MKKIRVLTLTSIWPQSGHTSRAANVVFFEMVRELAQFQDISLSLLKINLHEKDAHEGQITAQTELSNLGIEILPEVNLGPSSPPRSKWQRIMHPDLVDFYPEITHQAILRKTIDTFKPDLLLIPWSEVITAMCADFPYKKFAYYGNPDSKPQMAMARFNRKHGSLSPLKYAFYMAQFKNLKQMHLKTIAKYDILADVAANDAAYYVQNGISKAFYIQNIWIDRFGEETWKKLRADLENHHSPAIVIGNLGKLGATANTHGMELLGKEILPELKKIAGSTPYEVQLLGRGKLHPAVDFYFQNRAEVKIRGFVDDIDHELLKSQVFLCANNGSAFNVGHTRYLHAWSLGCCVIAHVNASLAMPEIKHGENALLGKNSKEIAAYILQALNNPSLRKRLGENGYHTFKKHFAAKPVAEKIAEKIRQII